MNIFSGNKLAMAAAALIIAGAVWYGFSDSSAPTPVLGTEGASGVVSSEDQDLVTSLLKLHSVTLTGTIFSSQAFLGLKDFSTDITQEPVGRIDPFAPLPAAASQSAAASGADNNTGASLFNKAKP